MSMQTKSKVEEFREFLPLVRALFNPGMRDRHWLQVSEIVGFDLRPADNMCLSHLLEMKLDVHITKFDAISEMASKEYSLEKALTKMKDEWEPVRLMSHVLYSCLYTVAVMFRAWTNDSTGRGFNFQPICFQVTTLGKLFTRMCLCHQAV